MKGHGEVKRGMMTTGRLLDKRPGLRRRAQVEQFQKSRPARRRNEPLAGEHQGGGENPVQRSQMVLKDHLDERGNVPQKPSAAPGESRGGHRLQYRWRPQWQC